MQVHMSPTLDAGMPAISTVGQPGGRIGPPTCGTGGVPGVTIGQVCISPTRAAGWPIAVSPCQTLLNPLVELSVLRSSRSWG